MVSDGFPRSGSEGDTGMAVSTRTEMSIEDFGKALLDTRDLDPVYVVLWRNYRGPGMAWPTLRKWLLAYWCFYHVGVASWIADGSEDASRDGYWTRMAEAASSSAYPRGTERRHFRGGKASAAVEWFRGRGLNYLFRPLLRRDSESLTLEAVVDTVTRWPQFGPWIAFKVADMLERLGIVPVEFNAGDVFRMFDSPRKGALEVAWRYSRERGEADLLKWTYNYMVQLFGHYFAPPSGNRKVNIQEFETILCKWHSHLTGHYYVGKDTHEIHEALERYSGSVVSRQLLRAGRLERLW
jgi:hypothetical protein